MSKKIPETTLWEGLSKDELREKASVVQILDELMENTEEPRFFWILL